MKKLPSPLRIVLLQAVLLGLLPAHALAGGKASHVIIVVWDGLRPDLVNAQNTPTLQKMRESGTFFARHHAVYPSTTEVNGTALATGMYPANSGIIGNREFRPAINPSEPSATESLDVVRKGDKLTGGKYLAVPTMYETLQAKGFSTVVAGTKPVAILPDRADLRPDGAAAKSANVFQGRILPESLQVGLEREFGKLPEQPAFPDVIRNSWTLDVLLKKLWKDEVPRLSLLWLSDPDFSQHNTQPGSDQALAALRENDKLLARLLAELDARGAASA